MNFTRIVPAALGAFVAYFLIGGLSFAVFSSLKTEFLKYPDVYRAQEGQMRHMPAGMAAMFVAILALAVLYAMLNQTGSGVARGLSFGALVGVFAIGAFVVHNYVNLNVGLTLTLQQCAAYFVEWLVVGMVIGLIYRPLPPT